MLFFTWAGRHQQAERNRLTVNEQQVLTYEQVQARFAETEPAAPERTG